MLFCLLSFTLSLFLTPLLQGCRRFPKLHRKATGTGADAVPKKGLVGSGVRACTLRVVCRDVARKFERVWLTASPHGCVPLRVVGGR